MQAGYPPCRPINGVNALKVDYWYLYLNIALSSSHTRRHLASVIKITTQFKHNLRLYFSMENIKTYHFTERLI